MTRLLGENIEQVAPFSQFVVEKRQAAHIEFLKCQHLARDVAPLAAAAFSLLDGQSPMPDVVAEFVTHALALEKQRVLLDLLDTFYLDCVLQVSQSSLDFAGKDHARFYAVWDLYQQESA